MRRLLATVCALFIGTCVFAQTGTVTAQLHASVTSYLLHGFRYDKDSSLTQSLDVQNALGPVGVDLPYTIDTNRYDRLIVYAEITPFVLEGNPSVKIPVKSVTLDGKAVFPEGSGNKGSDDAGSDSEVDVKKEDGPVSGTETYRLIEFSRDPGKFRYNYTIHLTANQDSVEDAPAGHYVSSVTLSIASGE